MEALNRLVAESLARHGFDLPVDPRRLQWSRWFRCDSPHSLLVVPSKPGVFAIAEEIGDLGPGNHVGTAAPGSPVEPSSAAQAEAGSRMYDAGPRRMLAVLQFCEDDDMAFVLDRMFTRANALRARLASARCFLRFVVIHDQAQRRSICAALNQWILTSAQKASGFTADFASSLEWPTDHVARSLPSAQAIGHDSDAATTNLVGTAALGCPAERSSAAAGNSLVGTAALEGLPRAQSTGPSERSSATPGSMPAADPLLDSGAASNTHCPPPFPSGF